jgi:hypothetical protein
MVVTGEESSRQYLSYLLWQSIHRSVNRMTASPPIIANKLVRVTNITNMLLFWR